MSFEIVDVGESLNRQFGLSHSCTPGVLLHGAQDHIIIAYDRRIDVDKQIVQKVLHFRLVRDERLASQTESARFPQQYQAEAFEVNDQWQLPEIRSRLAARAPGELRVGVRIQDKRVSRWQSANPIFLVSRSIHVQVWLTRQMSRAAAAS